MMPPNAKELMEKHDHVFPPPKEILYHNDFYYIVINKNEKTIYRRRDKLQLLDPLDIHSWYGEYVSVETSGGGNMSTWVIHLFMIDRCINKNELINLLNME